VSTATTGGVAYRMRRLRIYLRDLWSRREFAWYLAAGNIKARNASTTLGLFWWVLNPLLLGLVYFLVFGLLFGGSRPDDYVAYLLSGMFVFHFTHQSMTGGANSILQNTKLLANLKFPRMVLLIAAVIESAIGFAASLVVFYAIAIPTNGIYPSAATLWLAVVVPIHVLLNLGLAALVARVSVPFRDITNFLPYATRLWLYLSPVIWPLSLLESSDTLAAVARFNPMFQLIGVYRTALMGNAFDPSALVSSAAWAIGVFILGAALFVTYENRLVRYL
jgi:teichoic acid transport system permease protein